MESNGWVMWKMGTWLMTHAYPDEFSRSLVRETTWTGGFGKLYRMMVPPRQMSTVGYGGKILNIIIDMML